MPIAYRHYNLMVDKKYYDLNFFLNGFVKARIGKFKTYHPEFMLAPDEIFANRPLYTHENETVIRHLILLLSKCHHPVNSRCIMYKFMHPSHEKIKEGLNYIQKGISVHMDHFKKFIENEEKNPFNDKIMQLILPWDGNLIPLDEPNLLQKRIFFDNEMIHPDNKYLYFSTVEYYIEMITHILNNFSKKNLRICPFCGILHRTGKNKSRKYCSNRCSSMKSQRVLRRKKYPLASEFLEEHRMGLREAGYNNIQTLEDQIKNKKWDVIQNTVHIEFIKRNYV